LIQKIISECQRGTQKFAAPHRAILRSDHNYENYESIALGSQPLVLQRCDLVERVGMRPYPCDALVGCQPGECSETALRFTLEQTRAQTRAHLVAPNVPQCSVSAFPFSYSMILRDFRL